MDLLQILSNLQSSGSGSGISFYSQRCPRRARLNKERGDSGGSFKSQVGTVFHKLRELYHTNQLVDVVLPISDSPEDEDPVQEALRCFAVYIQLFPKDEFTIVACEQLIPANDKEKALVEATLGISPFTCRIDSVIHVSPEQALAIKERRKVDLVSGHYLLDIKTTDKKDAVAVFKYDLSVQFAAYMTVWSAVNPDKPLQGMIVDEVIRHVDLTKKEPDGSFRSFKTYVVQAPLESTKTGLRNWLKVKKAYMDSDHCELTACVEYGSVCSHYLDGNCNRV
jgi:hypothetical protein